MSRILIIEDEELIRTALRRLLERNSYVGFEAGSVKEALDNYTLSDFDLIITDLRLPGAPGTDIISHAGDIPVLLMTSYASVNSAVGAMKKGAADYITKPFDHGVMLEHIAAALTDHKSKKTKVAAPISESSEPVSSNQTNPVDELGTGSNSSLEPELSGIIGHSPRMLELFERIRKVAPTDATVLILGESGTGKELVAKAIHEQSRRTSGALISVNCAAIPETLIESELFGHEKGAFTGANATRKGLVEAANGGTLFLDEIGELPMEAQARLLRLLQDKTVRPVGSTESRQIDVRLVAATHRDLKTLANKQEFREDLYYRLKVVELKLPPLRERGDDVLELAQVFLASACEKLTKPYSQFADDALSLLSSYQWPGNVREMENAIERAVILSADDGLITADLLGLEADTTAVAFNVDRPASSPKIPSAADLDDPQEDLSLDDYFVRQVLALEGQMTETALAKKLGISRKNLWERRNRLGISRKKSSGKG